MKRPSPLVQMTLALVSLCSTLLIAADLLFGVMPDRGEQSMRLRRDISEALAVQVATLLRSDDRTGLQRTLDGVAERTPGVASLAIRRSDGSILLQSGHHQLHWHGLADGRRSVPEQVTVPLNAGGQPWGTFEIAFRPPPGGTVGRFLREPLVVTLAFFTVAGTLAFGLYMRRALQHLDPTAVIPERVQGAFDAMTEGVVVLDARARVMLANRTFRAMVGPDDAVTVGQPLSSLAWFGASLPADAQDHPWARAMADRAASAGHTLIVGGVDDPGEGEGGRDEDAWAAARHLVVNCAPVLDVGGHLRGCLVSFSDVSELHVANRALREAMGALETSRDEVQRQNVELERLATRDPMTGCLNRRAFLAAFDAALSDARRRAGALSCVMVDIDHFKKVNDTHGHAVGDRVIQEVARILLDTARGSDLVCRYGGEEFCVVLPGSDAAAARAFAERVRTRIGAEVGPGVRDVARMDVTASLGVDTLVAEVADGAALIDRADQALYRSKRGGRNQVQAYADAPAPTEASAPAPATPAPADAAVPA